MEKRSIRKRVRMVSRGEGFVFYAVRQHIFRVPCEFVFGKTSKRMERGFFADEKSAAEQNPRRVDGGETGSGAFALFSGIGKLAIPTGEGGEGEDGQKRPGIGIVQSR